MVIYNAFWDDDFFYLEEGRSRIIGWVFDVVKEPGKVGWFSIWLGLRLFSAQKSLLTFNLSQITNGEIAVGYKQICLANIFTVIQI